MIHPSRNPHIVLSPTRRALLAGLVGSAATGCAVPASPRAANLPDTWPGPEWERIAPEQAGWDAGTLAAAQDYSQGIGTASFTAAHHGRMWQAGVT